jgi:hypothetical protein
MADIMERQAELKLRLPKCVAVVGCGGVGSWVAYFLALAGVEKLWLFDDDEVSDHNLNRIPFPMSSVGKKKTQATAELITTVRPDCNVLAAGAFTADVADACQLASEISWIVATTDTLASRQQIFKWAKKNGPHYIEAAAEGEFGSCTGEPAEWFTPQELQPGYASVPVWVGPCVWAASIAVAHIIHGTRIGDRAIRLGWEKIKDKYGIRKEEFSMYDSRVEEEVEEVNEIQQEVEEKQNV